MIISDLTISHACSESTILRALCDEQRKRIVELLTTLGEITDLHNRAVQRAEAAEAREKGLHEALDTLSLIVGLTAFKYESDRKPLQEAFNQARAALAASEQKEPQGSVSGVSDHSDHFVRSDEMVQPEQVVSDTERLTWILDHPIASTQILLEGHTRLSFCKAIDAAIRGAKEWGND